jgi:hypothetical protein
MTANGDRAPLDQRASALVVGLETYPGLGQTADLRGAALSAARFALWLLKTGACAPGRLTVMVAYDPATYDGQPRSPDQVIKEFAAFEGKAGPRVKVVGHAAAQADFDEEWIKDQERRPHEEDRFFYFFWAGHGFTYPWWKDPRLCLLGTDADGHRMRNVELEDLLKTVAALAPDAHQVVLANACRAPVRVDWTDRLEGGTQRILLPESYAWPPQDPRPPAQSIIYAAAEGLTTKETGLPGKTLADTLVDKAETIRDDELPAVGQPLALFEKFGDDLAGIGKQRQWVDGASNPMVFRYAHGNRAEWNPPVRESQLTAAEWTDLLNIVRSIDRDEDGQRPTPAARWGAYYAAVDTRELGPDVIADKPGRLTSVEDLVGLLYARPANADAPTPLLIACDYLANLPHLRSRARLDDWCAGWAGNTNRPDGGVLLNAVRAQRPVRVAEDCYLSIVIKEAPPGPDNPKFRGNQEIWQYQTRALLWAYGGPQLLDGEDSVSGDMIVAAIGRLIQQAKARARGVRPRWHETIVELIVPRELLGRRLEYERESEATLPLGFAYPVVTRDLEQLRANGSSTSAEIAEQTLRLMGAFEPSDEDSWSGQVEWINCDLPSEERSWVITEAIANSVFCLVLEHGSHGNPARAGAHPQSPPDELLRSIEEGAAIVLSVHHLNGACGICENAPSNGAGPHSCPVTAAVRERFKTRLDGRIDRSSNGLWDLPVILRGNRRALLETMNIMVGVLIEDSSRLWAGWEAFASGAVAGN